MPSTAIDQVVTLVAAAFAVSGAELTDRARGSSNVMRARQVAFYLAVVDLELHRGSVALVFQRDRSSVGNAVRLVEDLRDDRAFDVMVHQLEVQLAEETGRCPPLAPSFLPSPAVERRIAA